jgi:hypothetical protein
MTALELYRVYLALKLHFTTEKFDIRKTPSIRTADKNFESKGGIRYALQRLVRKYKPVQCIEYLVANFVEGDKYGGAFSSNGERNYLEWQRRNQGLMYLYEQELIALHDLVAGDSIEELWTYTGEHPPLLKAFFGKTCSLETLVILENQFNFRMFLDHAMPHDPIWKETSHLIHKYNPFVGVNKEIVLAATKRIFEQ